MEKNKKIFSYVIRGKQGSGKSTLIRQICESLNPAKVLKLINLSKDKSQGKLVEADVKDILNDTFVIEVKGVYLLIVAGAPSEQEITIERLFEICSKELKKRISFILTARRFREPKEYNTNDWLYKNSKLLRVLVIEKESTINDIVTTINKHL